MPDLVVQPRSTEEVAAVMKICYENTIPVTPRGAGTGLAGGAVPLLGGVLLDMSKMNRILNYDLENFVVNIECGVLLNDLAADCLTKGMMWFHQRLCTRHDRCASNGRDHPPWCYGFQDLFRLFSVEPYDRL